MTTNGGSFSAEYFEPWKYNARSMYWWSTRYYANLVRHFKRQGRLLEVGCGLGHLLAMFDQNWDIFGVDISEFAVQATRQNAPNAHVLVADVAALGALPEAYFDVLIAKHVVEHLPDPRSAFVAFNRLLAPGGMLLIGTPNTKSALRGLKGDRWYALQDETHISLKPPAEWASLARSAGFQILRMFGDGLWDAPYLPLIPTALQRALFGLPAAIQVISGGTWMPVPMGESLVLIARK